MPDQSEIGRKGMYNDNNQYCVRGQLLFVSHDMLN